MLLQWENNTNIFKKIDAKDGLRRVGLKLEGQSFGMCDRGIYRVCVCVLYIYIYPFLEKRRWVRAVSKNVRATRMEQGDISGISSGVVPENA